MNKFLLDLIATPKDIITLVGVASSLGIGVINLFRTGKSNRVSLQNNRASKFEAMYGSILNNIDKEIKELVSMIEVECSAAASGRQLLDFYKVKLKSRLLRLDASVFTDIPEIRESKLVSRKASWIDVKEVEVSDAIWTVCGEIKANQSRAQNEQHLRGLVIHLNGLRKRINDARTSENNLI